MDPKALIVQNIFQVDNHTFAILWADGVRKNYRLSDLQKRCPCAGCVDEKTGNRISDAKLVKEDLRAVSLASVGRYALRIQFTTGCSQGIFGFDKLREL